ncbi:MAG TPA: PRC-barrel domain-containing protein [Ilumatobacter sp.]|nr:PRC-barrel domain-containing protein [Ilumatobacter sp.]
MNSNDMNPHDTGPNDMASEPISYTGHEVIDERGERIGEITDVIYDDPTNEVIGDPLMAPQPRWLVVDPGLLRAAHYVPVAGSYRAVDGAIVIPWDKDWIKSAPKARGDHLLSTVDLQDLAQHYAVTS